MGFLKRLFGVCETTPPTSSDCWNLSDGKVEIQLDRAPELANKGGAIRLEGKGTPEKVLVIHGYDGEFHAFKTGVPISGGVSTPLGPMNRSAAAAYPNPHLIIREK